LSEPEGGLQPVENRESVSHDPGRRLRRPEPEQHDRPKRERPVVVLDDPVLDRPPDRKGHERLSKHPDDPEEHTREQRAGLVPPHPKQQPRRRTRVWSAGVADRQANAAVANPATRWSEGCEKGLVHALMRDGVPPSDRNQTLDVDRGGSPGSRVDVGYRLGERPAVTAEVFGRVLLSP